MPFKFFRPLAVLVVVSFFSVAHAGEPPRQDTNKSKDQANNGGFPDLVASLKASPGCLGVETAQTSSGKQVIFAWFEDKKAALAWYDSDVHQALMKRFFPGNRGADHKPMANVPEEGPIMAIASITLTEKPTAEKPLPFKQIAIELYQPVTGGLAIGGKFSSETMKVPARKTEK